MLKLIMPRFLVIKYEISSIDVNTIVELHDAAFFEYVFPMKTNLPKNVSSIDSTSTTSSIPDHVERMTNVEGDPSI